MRGLLRSYKVLTFLEITLVLAFGQEIKQIQNLFSLPILNETLRLINDKKETTKVFKTLVV